MLTGLIAKLQNHEIDGLNALIASLVPDDSSESQSYTGLGGVGGSKADGDIERCKKIVVGWIQMDAFQMAQKNLEQMDMLISAREKEEKEDAQMQANNSDEESKDAYMEQQEESINILDEDAIKYLKEIDKWLLNEKKSYGNLKQDSRIFEDRRYYEDRETQFGLMTQNMSNALKKLDINIYPKNTKRSKTNKHSSSLNKHITSSKSTSNRSDQELYSKLQDLKTDLLKNMYRILSFLEKYNYSEARDYTIITSLRVQISEAKQFDLQNWMQRLEEAKLSIQEKVIEACEFMAKTSQKLVKGDKMQKVRQKIKEVVSGLDRKKNGLNEVVKSMTQKADRLMKGLGEINKSVESLASQSELIITKYKEEKKFIDDKIVASMRLLVNLKNDMQKSKEELSQTLKTQKQEQEQILKQQLQDLVCAIKSKCSEYNSVIHEFKKDT